MPVERTGPKVGRLIIAEFAGPTRLTRLGVTRFRAFAARRGMRVSTPVAQRLVEAARQALPTADAAVTRQVLVADRALLAAHDAQIAAADDRIKHLVPATRLHVLTTVPSGAAARRRRRRWCG